MDKLDVYEAQRRGYKVHFEPNPDEMVIWNPKNQLEIWTRKQNDKSPFAFIWKDGSEFYYTRKK